MKHKVLAILIGTSICVACGGSQRPSDQSTARVEDRRDEDRADRAVEGDRTAAERERAIERERVAEARPANTDVTAQDQSNTSGDLAITQQIRQAVVADNRLSMRAKNVTIVTQEGIVTLRGPASAHEREVIESLVRLVSGVRRLDDQIHVDGN